MSISSLSFFCLLSATIVYGNLAITSPVNSVWEMGTKNLITWTETGEGSPAPASFSLDLMQGPATGLQLIQQISKEVDVKEGQHSWEIPKTLQPGNYSLRAGSPPNVVYSTYFEIKSPGSGGISPPVSPPPKSTKKPEKETKKPHHDDQAKKVSGVEGTSGDAATAPAQPPGTPPLHPVTTQKSDSATPPDSKAPAPAPAPGTTANPAKPNSAETKKIQKNIGSLPNVIQGSYLMVIAIAIHSYRN
ncbi:hypothetical protein K7432_012643 [Basidiobolus ranarum]|uniref:Yeast cell wall synthesis Kre9/Knh1-like N-terminal domain-containing protein n=1 Tax=Basidiobolus ranarum TaxID=34480 RepID=A0ABR2VSE6_9FUNG